jgi:hypothetical protein
MTEAESRLLPLACGIRWPGGSYIEVARLAIADSHLKDYFGRDLISGDEPGLGPWRSIGMQSASGATAELISYDVEEGQGFTLRIDAISDPCSVFNEIVDELVPSMDEVLWRSPLTERTQKGRQ